MNILKTKKAIVPSIEIILVILSAIFSFFNKSIATVLVWCAIGFILFAIAVSTTFFQKLLGAK